MSEGIRPTHISTYSRWCSSWSANRTHGTALTVPASVTVPAADIAIYFPFILPWSYPVARVFWVNGSAVVSNIEVGIYNATALTKIYSTGAVAQSGASVAQYVDNTDFTLAPGAYYLAITCTGTTNALWGHVTATATQLRSMGLFQSSHAAGSLPATVTPVQMAQACHPLFGFTRMASGY